jgi:TatD DNase family protein
MTLVDTHTHLYSDAFSEDRNEMVQRSIDAGVNFMFLPNIDIESIDPMYSLCVDYPLNCFPMMGLHPGSVDENWEIKLAEIKNQLFKNKHIAVGEIGMDLYWDKTFLEQQRQAFRIQVEWAKELNLPIVIHAREAFEEIFAILDEINDANLKGVFHCFTGNIEQAEHIQTYGGFKFGIGGVVTYKKSGLDEVLKSIPLEDLILETDSPYLPPVPHRGKRNESSFLPLIAEKVADIYAIGIEKVAEITTNNALELFKPDPTINEGYLSIKGSISK